MSSTPADFELKIDEQTEKFLEVKQKLSYFLITASVAPMAFALTVIKDTPKEVHRPWLLALGAAGLLSGLSAAGSALLSIHYELQSYRKHIATRYARKTFDDLPLEDQKRWIAMNQFAAYFIKCSFITLFVEIALLAISLACALWTPRPPSPLLGSAPRLWP